VQALAADVAGLRAGAAAELVEFVRDADAHLAVVVADEAAVLAQFPAFPKARAARAAPRLGARLLMRVAAAAAPRRPQSRSRGCQTRAHCSACVLCLSSWRGEGWLAASSWGCKACLLAMARATKRGSHAPQARFDAMREAAAAFGELCELARREKQWLLQRVRPRDLRAPGPAARAPPMPGLPMCAVTHRRLHLGLYRRVAVCLQRAGHSDGLLLKSMLSVGEASQAQHAQVCMQAVQSCLGRRPHACGVAPGRAPGSGAQGTCEEEAARLETFLDTVRARAAIYAARQDPLQRKCAAHELPWEPRLFDDVAGNAMHLATLFMSRCAPRPRPAPVPSSLHRAEAPG